MTDRRTPHSGRGGNNQSIQGVVVLGTGAVSTQTKIVGSIPQKCRVVGIRFYGQAGPTATTLTAQVYARTTSGATGNSLQSAATDIDFASAAAAKTGVAASLTTTYANLRLTENQLLEVTVTASGCSAGPGDLLVEIDYEPRI